jgi:hypothetical protein
LTDELGRAKLGPRKGLSLKIKLERRKDLDMKNAELISYLQSLPLDADIRIGLFDSQTLEVYPNEMIFHDNLEGISFDNNPKTISLINVKGDIV